MKERWRNVIGFEGLYHVSNLGRVKSVDRVVMTRKGSGQYKGRILKTSNKISPDGAEFDSISIAAEIMGCSRQNIHKVCKGQRDVAMGFGWEYL